MININNPILLRMADLDALSKALGPVGMVKFLQQFDMGQGDYTKEKYLSEPLSMGDLDQELRNYMK